MTSPAAWRRALPAAGVAVGAATLVASLAIKLLRGQVGADDAPFYVALTPRVTPWLAVAVAALSVGLLVAPRLARLTVPTSTFAGAVFVLTLGLRLGLNTARDGPAAWYAVFGSAYEAQNEYLPALPALRLGVRGFLDRFAQLSATLPIHPSAHPPGMVLALHWLGIDGPRGMAALTIGVGALSAPLVYVLGRELLDESRARTAALFYAFAPSALLSGATSADALFATMAAAASVGLIARRRAWRSFGPLLLFVASFFSYALVSVGVWAAIVVARRDGVKRAALLAVACALALLAGYAALYALSGFDLLGSLHAANGAYRRGIAADRPYLYWLFGSPTAFFVALGLPLAWLVLRAAAEGRDAAVALIAVIVVAALIGFTKAETERIWQFLVPLACAAAAATTRSRSPWVLPALAAQALIVEVVLETRW